MDTWPFRSYKQHFQEGVPSTKNSKNVGHTDHWKITAHRHNGKEQKLYEQGMQHTEFFLLKLHWNNVITK
jgi:hypothetical protein